MKQKYVLSKNEDNTKLLMTEKAEADPGIFESTCEENFDLGSVEAALAKGKAEFVEFIRTHNIFPTDHIAGLLFDGITTLLSGDDEKVVVDYDDMDTITVVEDFFAGDEEEAEEVEIDKLLDEGETEEVKTDNISESSEIDTLLDDDDVKIDGAPNGDVGIEE